MRHYHNKKIYPLAFREGDLVLRRIQKSDGRHKLSSPWEGPFVVSRALKTMHITSLISGSRPNTWILRGKKRSVLGTPSCYVRFTVEWYICIPSLCGIIINENSRESMRLHSAGVMKLFV